LSAGGCTTWPGAKVGLGPGVARLVKLAVDLLHPLTGLLVAGVNREHPIELRIRVVFVVLPVGRRNVFLLLEEELAREQQCGYFLRTLRTLRSGVAARRWRGRGRRAFRPEEDSEHTDQKSKPGDSYDWIFFQILQVEEPFEARGVELGIRVLGREHVTHLHQSEHQITDLDEVASLQRRA
jgi:hypothetical protein